MRVVPLAALRVLVSARAAVDDRAREVDGGAGGVGEAACALQVEGVVAARGGGGVVVVVDVERVPAVARREHVVPALRGEGISRAVSRNQRVAPRGGGECITRARARGGRIRAVADRDAVGSAVAGGDGVGASTRGGNGGGAVARRDRIGAISRGDDGAAAVAQRQRIVAVAGSGEGTGIGAQSIVTVAGGDEVGVGLAGTGSRNTCNRRIGVIGDVEGVVAAHVDRAHVIRAPAAGGDGAREGGGREYIAEAVELARREGDGIERDAVAYLQGLHARDARPRNIPARDHCVARAVAGDAGAGRKPVVGLERVAAAAIARECVHAFAGLKLLSRRGGRGRVVAHEAGGKARYGGGERGDLRRCQRIAQIAQVILQHSQRAARRRHRKRDVARDVGQRHRQIPRIKPVRHREACRIVAHVERQHAQLVAVGLKDGNRLCAGVGIGQAGTNVPASSVMLLLVASLKVMVSPARGVLSEELMVEPAPKTIVLSVPETVALAPASTVMELLA